MSASPPTAAHPHAAPRRARVLAQAGLEARGLLSHGEQLLVSVVLPTLALLGLALTSQPDLGAGRRIDVATPGVLALAIISTAFTGQAILLAYERRYGVLRLLGTTPLGRGGLLAAKGLSVFAVLAVQFVVIGVVGAVLGWRPEVSGVLPALLAVLLGSWAFAALAVLIGGTLRAEGVLAVANLLWVLLLVGGGVMLAADQLPAPLAGVVSVLPSSALGDVLRAGLADGRWAWSDLGLLVAWAVPVSALAVRLLRWKD